MAVTIDEKDNAKAVYFLQKNGICIILFTTMLNVVMHGGAEVRIQV